MRRDRSFDDELHIDRARSSYARPRVVVVRGGDDVVVAEGRRLDRKLNGILFDICSENDRVCECRAVAIEEAAVNGEAL